MTNIEELEIWCAEMASDCEMLRRRLSDEGTTPDVMAAYREARVAYLNAQAELWAAREVEKVTA